MQPGTASELGLAEGAWCLAQLVVEDFAFFGDGCVFLDMVRPTPFLPLGDIIQRQPEWTNAVCGSKPPSAPT
jgi:hypothetical protein